MSDNHSPRKASHRQRGNEGEALAGKFLEEKGFRILAKNYRYGRSGEVDIVAMEGQTLVFIEVKLRRNTLFGSPEESVGFTKQKRIRLAAESYIYENDIQGLECRFDLVAIELRGGKSDIRHICSAF